MIFCPHSFAVFDLTLLYTFPEPPRIRHVMLLHVFSCTPTHTSCYAVLGSLKVPHVRHDDNGGDDDDDDAAAARLFPLVSGQAVAGVYTGLSPDVLTFLYWPVPRCVDSFILACPQDCAKHEYVQGGWGTHNNPSLNTFFLKALCLNVNFCVFRLAHPQAKIGRSYKYANALCKHLNVNHSM